MELRSSVALTLVVALVALAAPAAAQTDITVTIRGLGDRMSGNYDLADIATTTALPISASECADATIDFRFTMVDPARANLALYWGTGCDDPMVRTDIDNSSCTDLEVEQAIDSRSQVDWSIPIRDMIDCDGSSSGTRTIWVLALDEPVSTVTGTGQKVSFPVAFDFAGPATPAGFRVVDSEPAAELSWEGGSGNQITEYEIFFALGGCQDGEPTIEFDPAVDDPYDTARGTATTARVTYASDTPFGTESAVAIRAIDRAGNPSELTAIECTTRVEVTSWWDAYCGSGGAATDACDDSGMEGCAASPGGAGSLAGWALLPALGMFLARRRRR